MLPIERHNRIEQALRSARVVGTDDIARLLGVSIETVRRDFMTLEQRGVLTRVHGGAVSPDAVYTGTEPPYSDRIELALTSKAAIGRAAAELVSDGQTLLMDVGTTVLEAARALPADFHGTVATCSVLVAAELAGRPGIEVLLSGGRVRGGDLALSNAQTLAFFTDLRADIAFLGSGGVDAGAGLTDFYTDEVATRRLLIRNSVRCYALADLSKLGLVAPHRVCGFEEITGIITDGTAEDLRAAVERAGGAFLAA